MQAMTAQNISPLNNENRKKDHGENFAFFHFRPFCLCIACTLVSSHVSYATPFGPPRRARNDRGTRVRTQDDYARDLDQSGNIPDVRHLHFCSCCLLRRIVDSVLLFEEGGAKDERENGIRTRKSTDGHGSEKWLCCLTRKKRTCLMECTIYGSVNRRTHIAYDRCTVPLHRHREFTTSQRLTDCTIYFVGHFTHCILSETHKG